jgi:hypothetical protein
MDKLAAEKKQPAELLEAKTWLQTSCHPLLICGFICYVLAENSALSRTLL